MTAGERERLADALRRAGGLRAARSSSSSTTCAWSPSLADVVTVLDDGRAIAHGAPADVIADDGVQRVYRDAA